KVVDNKSNFPVKDSGIFWSPILLQIFVPYFIQVAGNSTTALSLTVVPVSKAQNLGTATYIFRSKLQQGLYYPTLTIDMAEVGTGKSIIYNVSTDPVEVNN